jgi:hypothetical protein
VVDAVSSALAGTVRVGRSRSAEYGLLATEKIRSQVALPQPDTGSNLIIYCVSDLALSDSANGSPVLAPAGSYFGVPVACLQEEQSYLRIRRYAPFNGKRRRFDVERQVIAKGSVLVFKTDSALTKDELDALQARLERGVGLYRQDGLGQVLVNPPFLSDFKFTAAAPQPVPVLETPVQDEIPPLAAWLQTRARARDEEQEVIRQVHEWIKDLTKENCPKNSQWGQLREFALHGKDVADILARVQQLCTEGVSRKQWARKVRVAGESMTYGDFLLLKLLEAERKKVDGTYSYTPGDDLSPATARKRLYLLGNRLPRANNQRNGGDQ